MESMLECAVCATGVDTRERIPKVLSCGHWFCSVCLGQMISGSIIMCPNCRSKSRVPGGQIRNLPTSFATLSILDSLCLECAKMPYDRKCSHCSKNLCLACLAEPPHSEDDTEEANMFNELCDVINRLTPLTSDDSDTKAIEKCRNDAMQDIAKVHKERLKRLEALHQQEKDDIETVVESNLTSISEWKTHLKRQLAETQHTMVTTQFGKLSKSETAVDARERKFKKVEASLSKKLSMLLQIENDKPVLSELPVGDICDGFSGISTTRKSLNRSLLSRHPSKDKTPNYKRAKFKANIESVSSTQTIDFTSVTNLHVSDSTRYITLVEHSSSSPDKSMVHFFDDAFMHKRSVHLESAYATCELGGKFYVTQSVKNQISVVDDRGVVERTIGGFDDNQYGPRCPLFKGPGGITKDKDGLLYVSNYGNRNIKVITAQGKMVSTIGSSEAFAYFCPLSLAVSRINKDIIVVDFGKNLHIFNSNGNLQKTLKAWEGDQISAVSVAADAHGNYIVTDESGRLVVLNEHGSVTCTIGCYGQGEGQLHRPVSGVVTGSGEILVCDRNNKRIVVYTVPMI